MGDNNQTEHDREVAAAAFRQRMQHTDQSPVQRLYDELAGGSAGLQQNASQQGGSHGRRLSGTTEVFYNCGVLYKSGEIRNYQRPAMCIDPPGRNGHGNLATYSCDGGLDQKWSFCYESGSDFTIRNHKSELLLDAGVYGNGNVAAYHYEPNRDGQRWRLGACFWLQVGGTWQYACQLKNKASNKCLDIAGVYGHGNIGTYSCEWYADQFFFVYERGSPVQQGQLINSQSAQCLDVAGRNGNGNIATWYCEIMQDQMWEQARFRGSTVMLKSKKSGTCLDVSGNNGYGGIATYACQYVPDQAWSWRPFSLWSPTVSWQKIICHNRDFDQTTEIGFSETNTITHEMAVTIAREISVGAEMFGMSASSSVELAYSFSTAWETSWEKRISKTVTCNSCLWQVVLTGSSSNWGSFTWQSMYTFCSPSKPTCQPVAALQPRYCYR